MCEDVWSYVWPAVDFDVVAMATTHAASPYAKKKRVVSRAVFSRAVVHTKMAEQDGRPPCRFKGLILR